MDKKYIYEKLIQILDKEDILVDEPMKNHTSFKVGGSADILVKPKTEDQIKKIISLVKDEKVPFFLMGNGSNLLVKDNGIRGIVIKISENFSEFKIEGNIVEAQSGILLSIVAKSILRSSLAGFEFASGIPGTLGGALAMNAGAYGGEMKDIVKSVRVIDMDGNIFEFENEEMKFGYRRSIITDKNYIALSAKLDLKPGSYEEIRDKMNELTQKRTTKQPLSMPSAGSTFKRPTGHFAGKLIEDCGLRGLTLRGAQVSEKHCGFVVSLGETTAKDVLNLIYVIKSTVYAKFGVMLEEEVKIVGED
jgi:UDP-N-acetylmuramate dehydrogenase